VWDKPGQAPHQTDDEVNQNGKSVGDGLAGCIMILLAVSVVLQSSRFICCDDEL
jgi:hypothetical protein